MNTNEQLLLENVLLCDPISKRGRAALNRLKKQISKTLTFKDFYDEVYVPPFFVELKGVGNDFGIFNIDSDNFSFTLTGSDINNLNDKMEKFESLFNEKSSDELLFIKASAGSGKSIYLNYLKRERRRLYHPELIDSVFLNSIINEAYELNFDLEKSTETITAGGIQFPFNSYNSVKNQTIIFNSQWHFYIMILKSIYDNCFELIEKNRINRDLFINNFNHIYGSDYSDEIKELFDFVVYTKYDQKNERTIKKSLLIKIAAACFEDTNNTLLNTKKALEVLFRLLTMILDLDAPEQILISFDNIEHLINNKKRIYDEDISKIIRVISDFIESESKLYGEKGLNFAECFKVVIVIRDTTEKMLYGDVQDNFIQDDRSINIAGWFLLERIYNNKFAYFNLDKNLSSVKFIDLITNDSLKSLKNNLMNQISIMYNHNNRRTTRILTRISTLFDQIDLNIHTQKDSINYEKYVEIWEWPEKNHIKFLCRQAVLRLIYNIIKNTYYFDKLYNNINKFGIPQNTYAHRILTWLANKESHKNNEYYSLKEIINNVLKSPDLEEYEFDNDSLFDICNVLIALDEYRFAYDSDLLKSKTEPGPNCWCQLIIIKYNESFVRNQLTTQMLADEIKKQYNHDEINYITGIRLTEAGYFYANKLCDFEYFSCQYSGTNYPLVFMINKKQIINTIKQVYTAAKKMIDLTIRYELQFFLDDCNLAFEKEHNLKIRSNNNNIIYQSIPYRIINQHITYLDAYRQYISDDELHDAIKIFDKTTRDCIEEQVNHYISLYIDVKNQISDSCFDLSDGTKVDSYILTKSE